MNGTKEASRDSGLAYYVSGMVVSGGPVLLAFRNMPNTVRNLSRVLDLGSFLELLVSCGWTADKHARRGAHMSKPLLL